MKNAKETTATKDMKSLLGSIQKTHVIYPVKKSYPWGDCYFVRLDSRNINNGNLQHVYFEVESEQQAKRTIEDVARVIRATKDKCVIGPFQHENYHRLASKPVKIEAGYYEYRGYEIIDTCRDLLLGGGGSRKDRWVATEKSWPEGKHFGNFDRLKDAMLSIDLCLSANLNGRR